MLCRFRELAVLWFGFWFCLKADRSCQPDRPCACPLLSCRPYRCRRTDFPAAVPPLRNSVHPGVRDFSPRCSAGRHLCTSPAAAHDACFSGYFLPVQLSKCAGSGIPSVFPPGGTSLPVFPSRGDTVTRPGDPITEKKLRTQKGPQLLRQAVALCRETPYN